MWMGKTWCIYLHAQNISAAKDRVQVVSSSSHIQASALVPCCRLAIAMQLSGKDDHHYFGRPEHATNPRPVYTADPSTGGADLVGEYAAAYAAGAVLFKSIGQGSYAAILYKHAKQAFAFAQAHQNV